MKLAVVVLALASFAIAERKQVREIHLSDYVDRVNLANWSVDAVDAAFSPDSKFLAITTYRGQHDARMFIFDVAFPSTRPRQFEPDACPQDIQWSPTGAAIKICDAVLRLSDGKTCHENRSAKFVDDEHTTYFEARSLVLADLNCKTTASWAVDGNWSVEASAPARGLVLLRSADLMEVLDVKTREVVHHWLRKTAADGPASFTEDGAAICLLDSFRKVQLKCWEVRTGGEISLASKLSGTLEATSASASRIVMNTSVHIPLDITDGGCCTFLHRRKVFDLRSNREIASWPWRWDPAYLWNVCVMSADGRQVAEGGKGVVRLYRLTP